MGFKNIEIRIKKTAVIHKDFSYDDDFTETVSDKYTQFINVKQLVVEIESEWRRLFNYDTITVESQSMEVYIDDKLIYSNSYNKEVD